MYPHFAAGPQAPILCFLREYVNLYIHVIRSGYKLTAAKRATLAAPDLLDSEANITTIAFTVCTADNSKLLQCTGPANIAEQGVHFPCHFLFLWLIQE
jgi:hypothetical protein